MGAAPAARAAAQLRYVAPLFMARELEREAVWLLRFFFAELFFPFLKSWYVVVSRASVGTPAQVDTLTVAKTSDRPAAQNILCFILRTKHKSVNEPLKQGREINRNISKSSPDPIC